MGVYIKGMEMPKEGRLTLQISADGAVYVVNSCSITAETYTTDAVPVPPHIRLLWDKHVIETFSDAILAEAEKTGKVRATSNEIISVVSAVPTVIPADVTDTNDGNILADPEEENEQSITVG